MTHIEQRYDTSSGWTASNPVLNLGEVGWETNTRKSKLGDGSTPWNSLAYTTAVVTVTKADVGLGSVDNTADTDKPVSGPVSGALALKAPKASPVFTGTPTAPTPDTTDNSTTIATTEFVKDQPFAPIDSPSLTGNPLAPTPSPGDNDASIATTAFVKAAIDASFAVTSSSSKATAATGWSITSQSWIRLGRMIAVHMSVTRTGADLVASASGDITNTAIATIADTTWRPLVLSGIDPAGSGSMWTGYVQTDGGIFVASLQGDVDWTTSQVRSFTALFIAAG